MATIELKKNATVEDLIEQMHRYLPNHLAQMAYFQSEFRGENYFQVGENVFAYLKKLKYKADNNRQVIKTPYRLVISGFGDCKSFSIFAASVLLSFGAKTRWVYSTNTNPDEPEHVYVQFVYDDEIITLDATICCYNKIPQAKEIWTTKWMQLR